MHSRRNLLKKVTLGVLLILLALGWQFTSAFKKSREALRQELDRTKAEHAMLLAEKRSLLATAPARAELEHLTKAHAELPRLRGELAQARYDLLDAQQALLAAKKKAQSSATPSSEADYVETFGAAFETRVVPGHTVVSGGWRNSDGKRIFVFFTPESPSTPASDARVTMTGRFIAVADDATAKLGLDVLRTEARQISSHEVLAENQLTELLAKLGSMEQTEGQILASPQAVVISGQEATMSMTHSMRSPDGETLRLGTSLKVKASLSADGSTIGLVTAIDFRLPKSPPTTP